MANHDSLKYTPRAIGLHWLIALFILCLMTVGFTMGDLPESADAPRGMVFNWHMTFGLITGLLILYRYWWRSKNPPPILPPEIPQWEVRLANVSHRLLYACMFVMPASGYLGSNFHPLGYGVKLFNAIDLPAWGWPSEEIYDIFNGTHKAVALVLATLIALHFAATFKHLFSDNGVFRRMVP
jgi:cytochrome b561